MYKIKLMNEFLNGPIWIYNENGMIIREYSLITDDEVLMRLNEEAGHLYDECYSFDKNNQPCIFDEARYQKNYPKMKKIFGKIIDRLNEINDGSFEVETPCM